MCFIKMHVKSKTISLLFQVWLHIWSLYMYCISIFDFRFLIPFLPVWSFPEDITSASVNRLWWATHTVTPAGHRHWGCVWTINSHASPLMWFSEGTVSKITKNIQSKLEPRSVQFFIKQNGSGSDNWLDEPFLIDNTGMHLWRSYQLN